MHVTTAGSLEERWRCDDQSKSTLNSVLYPVQIERSASSVHSNDRYVSFGRLYIRKERRNRNSHTAPHSNTSRWRYTILLKHSTAQQWRHLRHRKTPHSRRLPCGIVNIKCFVFSATLDRVICPVQINMPQLVSNESIHVLPSTQ